MRGLRGRGNTLQENLRGDRPHLPQRLAYRRQSRILKRGALNVVEAYDGNILGHPAAGFPKRLNRADGGNVVKSEQRSEWFSASEKFLRDLIPQ